MPGLEEHLAACLMDSIHDFLPSLAMILGYHHRRVGPMRSGPINKSSLANDEASSVLCPLRIVVDLGLARLHIIDTPVSSHSTHDDSVPKCKLTAANGNGLQKT